MIAAVVDASMARGARRRSVCAVVAGLFLAVQGLFGLVASAAQSSVAVTGDRLSGFVLPIEPVEGQVRLSALNARAWTIDDTKRLHLEGDVRIEIGSHVFMADDAAVWINRLPIGPAPGRAPEAGRRLVNQIAVFFDDVRDPAKESGASVGGGELLVTASSIGEVSLNVARLVNSPSDTGLVRRAERRLADHLRGLAGNDPALESQPQFDRPTAEPPFEPIPGGRVEQDGPTLPRTIDLPPTRAATPWLARPGGEVRFSADLIQRARGTDESTITIIGSIVIETTGEERDADDASGGLPNMTLTAERAVIFARPSPLAELGERLESRDVRGIYLEGAVTATTADGEYSLRAPRVYYDFARQQAIMLESVLRVQPRGATLPVYARAQEMRQIAENQWRAGRVSVSTSEFHTPHLAIGSEQMTVTQLPPSGGGGDPDRQVHIDSTGNALEFSGVPVVPWPRFHGTVDSVPLKSVEVGSRDNDGVRVLTTWDLFTLTGAERPDGIEADLNVDGFTERGAGVGLDFRYDVAGSEGLIDLYGLYDEGIDRTSSGLDVEPEHEFRGVALLEHQTRLGRFWTFQAQASYISDETFISAWREDDFLERREYETSLYLKHQRENAALTLLGKYSLNDFLSNDYLLASRQYSVDKLPELTYRRLGDSLFGDRFTYSTENRVTRMALAFQHTTPAEAGVRGRAFGIDDDVLISDSLRARGLTENWVSRIDSRHELSLPIQSGAFNITPFIVGRFTGYDDEFDEFSSDTDDMRLWGGGGVRLSARFQRVDSSVENRLLDLHRLRHIVEPYATLWGAHSDLDQADLPIYDDDVESIADGWAAQVGVRNTWQTYRGAAGTWRSVDWITLDTFVVLDDERDPDESPTPQFFDYRPELSQFGDHARATLIWLISDSLAVTGETTFALGPSEFARSSAGIELRHSPLLTTYIEYRVIEASENELLAVNWTYQLTPKYRLSLVPQYDFQEEDLRSLNARLTRSFPDFDFTLQVRYDQIRDDTTIGASLGLARF